MTIQRMTSFGSRTDTRLRTGIRVRFGPHACRNVLPGEICLFVTFLIRGSEIVPPIRVTRATRPRADSCARHLLAKFFAAALQKREFVLPADDFAKDRFYCANGSRQADGASTPWLFCHGNS